MALLHLFALTLSTRSRVALELSERDHPTLLTEPGAIDFLNPPKRTKAGSLPGFPLNADGKLPGGFEFYTGYLNGGTPPSGEGTLFFYYVCALPPRWETLPLTMVRPRSAAGAATAAAASALAEIRGSISL